MQAKRIAWDKDASLFRSNSALATAAAGVLALIGAVMLRDTSDNNADQPPIGAELTAPTVAEEGRLTELNSDQQAAIAVVIAHNDAQNARDGETMLATLMATPEPATIQPAVIWEPRALNLSCNSPAD